MREPLSIDKKSERYKTRFTKAKDLDEVHFEKEKVSSTPQNVRRRNTSEIITKKYEQGLVTVHDTIRNDERTKKMQVYTEIAC